ncbi:hypothetical protein B5M42_004450 [Paenibacillus athensensis]|uniref:Uncharacterized protein n=1 Tax=Paenibacillus athensensis TaxID=1967502 RepID=A0A4Y8PQB4_9BACL|nr:hypothetical protein [Paenibacillus athensensis]MCD1258089.1 hypothetical protein [Paenibacillus athensensis]
MSVFRLDISESSTPASHFIESFDVQLHNQGREDLDMIVQAFDQNGSMLLASLHLNSPSAPDMTVMLRGVQTNRQPFFIHLVTGMEQLVAAAVSVTLRSQRDVLGTADGQLFVRQHDRR